LVKNMYNKLLNNELSRKKHKKYELNYLKLQ
jgi:hypothetical protein